jgi:hypothetical protein
MSAQHRRLFLIVAAAAAVLLAQGAATSQYQYAPAPAYGGYPVAPGGWYGSGQALDAYANLGVSQEQARVVREQANQAKLQTKKDTIDTMEYERQHAYGYADEVADSQMKLVQRMMNNPPVLEITNGKALNVLVPYVDKLINMGKVGPDMPLDPYVVKSLNVAVGDSGGNAGMIPELNTIEWPLGLVGPEQKKLDALIQKASIEARSGPVPLMELKDIDKLTNALETSMKNKYYKSEIDAGEWLDSSRFIARLRDTTKALKSPNISRVLSGSMDVSGSTVVQVVFNMSTKGLTFAGAQPGQEGAYMAFYRGLQNFVMGAGATDTSFRMRLSGTPGVTAKQGVQR